jgi:hypothetical protein
MAKPTKRVSRDFFPMPGSERIITKKSKPIPHAFVLEAISARSPWTRSMFGCLAVYVENKIVFILQDKPNYRADNGVWIATTKEHHESLRRELPSMRSIQVLGSGVTGWQVLPQEDEHFEEAALRACELILAGDPRIGKIPGAKRKSAAKSAKNKRDLKQEMKKPARKPKRSPANSR